MCSVFVISRSAGSLRFFLARSCGADLCLIIAQRQKKATFNRRGPDGFFILPLPGRSFLPLSGKRKVRRNTRFSSGGKGTIWGTLIGALLMATIRNGLNSMQAPKALQYVVIGAVIVAAVTLDVVRNKMEAKARRLAAK